MSGPDPTILKILSGVQAGVEVALPDATYTLGSGGDDDIQLIDVSLVAAHARLRIAAGTVEIAAVAGSLSTMTGLSLDPTSDWHALEPLEVVTAGTTQFALGPRSANWATIADERRRAMRPDAAPAVAAGAAWAATSRLRGLALPVLGLLLLIGCAGWYGLSATGRAGMAGRGGNDLGTVRATLDRFPFGRDVESHQEVDGAIYVNGYVATPVERRALAGALESTGVPLRVRLWVLATLSGEIADLIRSQKVDVTFDLTPQGRLTLDGLILDKAERDRFLALLSDQIMGLGQVDSRIRTAETLLGDVRRLVAVSQLQPWLLLRLDHQLIEVNGVLTIEKVDAWVGFLQAYASRFSAQIPLRSFVQLQSPGGKLVPAPGGGITIGRDGSADGSLPLDLDKLKNGTFKLSDVFIGAPADTDRERLGPGGPTHGVDDARKPADPPPGNAPVRRPRP